MATLEQLVLDSLALNDDVTYRLQGLEMPPPPKKLEWVSGADSDGGVLGRDPLHENREVTARIRIAPQTTMDLALAAIAAISDKLEETERNINGIDLVWTPATSTKSYTLKVLSGEITELPIDRTGDSGWFLRMPVVVIKLICRPFGYGTEVVGTPSSSSLPLMTVELTGVTGDVPAEGRLIITDNATKDRRHVEWGLESRFYPTSSPPALILDSDSLVTSGFSGTGTTRTGAYDPGAAGNSVVRGTLAIQAIAVCGTGVQAHVGTFRVKARVWAATSSPQQVYLRMAWQEGDGPFRANAYTTPAVINGFAEVDLGLITIPEKELGTQKWTGTVQAYTSVVGDTLDIDYLLLIPAAEGYGVARTSSGYQPGVLVARDEFTGTTATNALNARVAPLGGTWATSGDTTDFAFTDSTSFANPMEAVGRATGGESTGRFAILGSTNYTDVEVGVSAGVDQGTDASSSAIVRLGVIARYVDNSNFLRLSIYEQFGSPSQNLVLENVVAGVSTILDQTSVLLEYGKMYVLRIVARAGGQVIGQYLNSTATVVIAQLSATSTVLATGGTLATGKPGFHDRHSSATAGKGGFYDNFYAATPIAETITVYSAQSLEVRSDSALREDSTGTYWGAAPGYRGSRFYVPPAGTRSRKTRVAVKLRRNDVLTGPDDQIADSATVQVNYTPRYLAVPR